ncbi:MAG: CRISPR-associated protein Cas8a1/Csx13 [Deltaproteobacteria bacterium HGW-Deltaproteobacteria-22]|nr:MAG: CRISPR-associated protein Cas8a1/Csx13 [Deltaproteobacteria bacterium HGW-Deltaproteobacteria-22]
MISLKDVPGSVLQGVSLLQRTYPAKIILNEKKGEWNWWVAVSAVRGLFANNLALGQPWYQDFQKLMASKTVAQKARYGFQGLDGKGGFEEMIEHATFIEPVHKLFIQAMHEAIRRRYGALAARSAEKGERIPFDREFERMRTGLARAKNQQTLRAEIADLFSRSGTNSVLQAGWHDLLPLLEGRDWQMVRDLALIALASYGGKEAVVTEVGEEIEE